jgi:hypothetical protein
VTIPYTLKTAEIERQYNVEGGAPDTTDDRSKRRLTIRPRKVTTHSRDINNPHVVHYITVEGRAVRRSDGELGASRLIGYSAKRREDGWADILPAWIREILDSEGLKFEFDR